MQEIFDQYQSGVQITNVTMQNVQPPEDVQAAFDDAVKAGQDRERQKNEGEAYANAVIPRARGTASRLIQEAEGYRDQVVANAEGNASRFRMIVEEYQKAPGVTRDRMYIETMQEIFSNTTKLMMDVKSGSNLLYLPFDKLIAQTAAQSPSSDAAVQPSDGMSRVPVPAQPAVTDSGRGRESRDRGGR
jgi:membrane protease subunit HflK